MFNPRVVELRCEVRGEELTCGVRDRGDEEEEPL